MKILFEDYTFNAASKQITFDTTSTIGLEQLLVITNVTTNTIIYNFADPSAGGAIANNVLTLDYNTTSMSDTDKLQIFLDNLDTPAADETVILLRRLVKLSEPLATQDSAQRQRIAVEIIPTITVGTLNNIAAYGGVDPRYQFIDAARLTYAQGIRNNLQFS